jgi:hypothetical protein
LLDIFGGISYSSTNFISFVKKYNMTTATFIITYALTFSAGMCFATGLIKCLIKCKNGERKKAYIDFFHAAGAILLVALIWLAP